MSLVLKIISKLTLMAFLVLAVVYSNTVELHAEISPGALAKMRAPRPPEPPQQNPHSPTTQADRQRVAFAQEAIRLHLMRTPSQAAVQVGSLKLGKNFHNKDRACLKSPACYLQDQAYVAELMSFHRQYGPLVEMRHAHIIPWSWQRFQTSAAQEALPQKPLDPNVIVEAQSKADSPRRRQMGPVLKSDEYMIHLYARFGENPRWYHLDVILTEDDKGKIALRHFYTILMPSRGGSLPPGVKC